MQIANLSALAANLETVFGEEHVRKDDCVVCLDFDGATLSFIVREEGDCFLLCRAFVTALTRMKDPGAFCQQALEANFFWRGTRGGCLSVNADATAMYLTERVPAEEVAGENQLFVYVQNFTRTLVDWRLRARSAQGGVEALPQSADFSLPEAERAPAEELELDNGAMMMEV